jgi:hypothetical protein
LRLSRPWRLLGTGYDEEHERAERESLYHDHPLQFRNDSNLTKSRLIRNAETVKPFIRISV